MKKILGIIVLCLSWCNVSFAKDLKGTKLLCIYESNAMKRYTSFEFLNESKVKLYKISTPTSWIITTKETIYKVTPNKIKIHLENIDRENLTLGILKAKCEIKKQDWKVLNEMKLILKKLIKEQEKKNKI